ncbi:BON domain-containing protein [Bradyrhizobium sp.]|jgi:osmotically-inducible protein OsmY|uniref:BON domain-containing protein n=1 Tax=Bradyrhizobium sp. TaxID=376 RepID=UPI003C229DF3
MTDQDLKQSVLDELAWDPSVSEAHIGVTAHAGVVTLTGHVASYAEKCAAEHAVGRVSGVKAIAEELEIRYLYDAGHGDEDIARQALNVLAWDLAVPKGKVRVKVEKGWITLSGEVHWYYQKNAAEKDVRKLFGVMGVSNLIAIEPVVHASDIQDKIKAAFGRNAEFEAAHIVVSTEGSRITLSGKVDSYYERTLAENTAWSAPGVTAVNDLITIN